MPTKTKRQRKRKKDGFNALLEAAEDLFAPDELPQNREYARGVFELLARFQMSCGIEGQENNGGRNETTDELAAENLVRIGLISDFKEAHRFLYGGE